LITNLGGVVGGVVIAVCFVGRLLLAVLGLVILGFLIPGLVPVCLVGGLLLGVFVFFVLGFILVRRFLLVVVWFVLFVVVLLLLWQGRRWRGCVQDSGTYCRRRLGRKTITIITIACSAEGVH
jgi:hypothetical protein